jgi:hypothetical protein
MNKNRNFKKGQFILKKRTKEILRPKNSITELKIQE